MALRVSGVLASTAARSQLRVSTLSVAVEEAVLLSLDPITGVEPGSVVEFSHPAVEMGTYKITSDLDVRGTGRTLRFLAPARVSAQSYTVTWTVSRAGRPDLVTPQRIDVLPATLRVVRGGVEVGSYWADSASANLGPAAVRA